MNKLNLLSRAEMKKVMGGDGIAEDQIGADQNPSVAACENKKIGDFCTLSSKTGTCVQGGWVYIVCNVPHD